MASIITNVNVFDFMGTPTDQRTTQGSLITALIVEIQAEVEALLRRSVTSQAITVEYLENEKNCSIIDDKIFLNGVLRDTYSITALTEEGTALTESVAYDDDNDYIFDTKKGIIKNITGNWSTANLAIAITGKYGYVQTDDTAREDVKLIITEWVAARSGLWKKTFISPDGAVTTVKDKVDSDFKSKLKGHINYLL